MNKMKVIKTKWENVPDLTNDEKKLYPQKNMEYLSLYSAVYMKLPQKFFEALMLFYFFERLVKFIYSEKATNFCEISTVDLTFTT